MQETPARFTRMLMELTTPEPFKFTTFPANGMDEMVVVQDIPVISLCAHHIVPFIGKAHVGYVPDKTVAGLSKLARTVQYHQRQLGTQEGLTEAIAGFLENKLAPKGVAVVLQCEHLCMTIRGVQTPGTLTTTSKMTGVFADHNRLARGEFLSIIGVGK